MRRIAKLLYAILKAHHSYREAVLFKQYVQASCERDAIAQRYMTKKSWPVGKLYEYDRDSALIIARNSPCLMHCLVEVRPDHLAVVSMAGEKADVEAIFGTLFPTKQTQETECIGK